MKRKMLCIPMIILLTGCLAIPVSPPPSAINQRSTPSIESENIFTATTPDWPTNTITIPAPTIPPDANLGVQCIEITQNISRISDMNSSVVLATQENPKRVFLQDSNFNETELINDSQNSITRSFMASFDGNWLAFIQVDLDESRNALQRWVVLISSDGKTHRKRPVDLGVELVCWLDNERLTLSYGLAPRSKQFVLNPFTDFQEDLGLTLSDLYDLPVTNNRWGNILIYNPSLTRVVYAGIPADIVMVDVKSKNTITRISPVPVVHAMPKWSPDGQKVVIAYADILDPINDPKNWTFELYSIDQEGEFNQLTNLSVYYNHPRIPFYYWSPNGRYIAFWLESDPNQTPGVFEFSLLDLSTDKVTNYCVETVPKGQIPNIFWSPDSEWVAFETIEQNDGKTKHVVIVNILHSRATQIAENLDLVGWMVTPP